MMNEPVLRVVALFTKVGGQVPGAAQSPGHQGAPAAGRALRGYAPEPPGFCVGPGGTGRGHSM